LATAARLAVLTGGRLTVILVVDASRSDPHLQEEVDERLQVQQVKGRYRQLVDPAAEELAQAYAWLEAA
jgi:hypothetical protein